jgi:ferredoxin
MSGYRDDWEDELRARVEAEVMACIGCNDCLADCPLTEAGRVTIADLNATVLADRVTLANVADFVMACTQCQRCVPACPADLSRADMVLWNQLKLRDAYPDSRMKLQIGDAVADSDWTLDHVADFLGRIELFNPAPRPALRRMLLGATLRRLKPGEVLRRAGSLDDPRLNVVLDGRIEQVAPHTRGDRTRLLALGPGSVHGEVAVMNNQPEPFTVMAADTALVIEIPRTMGLGNCCDKPCCVCCSPMNAFISKAPRPARSTWCVPVSSG